MKLLFKDKEEFENFCKDGSSACPDELGFRGALLGEHCIPTENCQKCWEQSGAEIIFEDDKRSVVKEEKYDELDELVKHHESVCSNLIGGYEYKRLVAELRELLTKYNDEQ